MNAFVRRFIGNEKVEEAFARVLGYAVEVDSQSDRDCIDDMARVFVQDRITCKCGCTLYKVAYNCCQYIVTPAYLLMLAERGRIKNREYAVKMSKAGRKYVDVRNMKHIKSNWTFAQYAGREVINDFAFLP